MAYAIHYYGYLAHHGIKGQKWGIRRYENPDGTLTEAGKRRYYTSGYKTGALYGKKAMNASARRFSDIQKFVKKNAKANNEKLTEEQIRYRIAEEYVRGKGKTNIGKADAARDASAYYRKKALGKQAVTNVIGYAFATAGLGWFQFRNPKAKRMKETYRIATTIALQNIKDNPALIENF